jgi:nitrogen PTS system EIIA component
MSTSFEKGIIAVQLGVRDVAELFSVSEKTVYRWVKQRKLPVYRVNEQYRFSRAELLEWATATRTSVTPQIMHEPQEDHVPQPRLHEALQEGGVHYRVSGKDKASVLHEVVQIMRLPEEVDRGYLYEVLLAREALGSTGIGDGIAIPHVRNPIVLHIFRPTIAVCFLEQEVDFGALDGQAVGILFTLISPTVRAHLHLLSKLTFALSDARFRDVVMNHGSRPEILNEARRVDDCLPAVATRPAVIT